MMNWVKRPQSGEAVVVNVSSQDDMLAKMRAAFRNKAGFTIATINLDHVVKLATNSAFLDAYKRHNYITADGNPIVWLSRLAGQEVALVTGSDLVIPSAKLAADQGVPVALFGANEASLEGAAEVLSVKANGLNIVAQIAPPMGFDPAGAAADAFIEELDESGAKFVFLALGAPKQEIFAARASGKLLQTGFLSIGAGLDFLSGQQRRAPRIFQTLAIEWVWRILTNDRRMMGRYLACIGVLPWALFRALRLRFTGQNEKPTGGGKLAP